MAQMSLTIVAFSCHKHEHAPRIERNGHYTLHVYHGNLHPVFPPKNPSVMHLTIAVLEMAQMPQASHNRGIFFLKFTPKWILHQFSWLELLYNPFPPFPGTKDEQMAKKNLQIGSISHRKALLQCTVMGSCRSGTPLSLTVANAITTSVSESIMQPWRRRDRTAEYRCSSSESVSHFGRPGCLRTPFTVRVLHQVLTVLAGGHCLPSSLSKLLYPFWLKEEQHFRFSSAVQPAQGDTTRVFFGRCVWARCLREEIPRS